MLAEAGGAWAFRTAPDLADRPRLALAPQRRLPRVAMEVLALIALLQPVTRPEMEAVRGVSLGQGSIDVLLDAGLIRPAGRGASDAVGDDAAFPGAVRPAQPA